MLHRTCLFEDLHGAFPHNGKSMKDVHSSVHELRLSSKFAWKKPWKKQDSRPSVNRSSSHNVSTDFWVLALIAQCSQWMFRDDPVDNATSTGDTCGRFVLTGWRAAAWAWGWARWSGAGSRAVTCSPWSPPSPPRELHNNTETCDELLHQPSTTLRTHTVLCGHYCTVGPLVRGHFIQTTPSVVKNPRQKSFTSILANLKIGKGYILRMVLMNVEVLKLMML